MPFHNVKMQPCRTGQQEPHCDHKQNGGSQFHARSLAELVPKSVHPGIVESARTMPSVPGASVFSFSFQ